MKELGTFLAAIILAMAMTGCTDNGFTIISSYSSVAHRVSLGDGFQAVPGQEVVVDAYLTLEAQEVAFSQLTLSNGLPVEHGAILPVDSAGIAASGLRGARDVLFPDYKNRQRMTFYLPLDTPTGVTLEMSYVAQDANGVAYHATAPLKMVSRQDAGRVANYTWDLRLFAEYRQPEDAIPEISVFDVDAVMAIMRSLYPSDYEEDKFPVPLLLQPQTGVVAGSKNLSIQCNLPVGAGYCVALEDDFNAESDKDYDLWFAAQPRSGEFILEAKGVSYMGAKNKTDLLFTEVSDGFVKVRISSFRREQGASQYKFQDSTTHNLVDGSVRIDLWENQKNVLNSDKYQWKYEVTFLEDPVMAGM